MTGLPIANSNPQAAPASAITATAQKNDTANVQPADPFGAVLARRIQADEADDSASNTASSELGIEVKATVDSTIQTGKTDQDNTPVTTNISNDLSAALAAMLQLPQEAKPSVAKDVSASTMTSGMINAAAAARGMADAAATIRGMADMTAMSEVRTNKTEVDQLTANAGTKQTKAGFGMTTTALGKAVADKTASRDGPGPDITKFTELPASLPDAARSAQGITQSTVSVATSGVLPTILVNDKITSGLQSISSPLGSRGWAEEFSQKITWMGTQQNQVAELHLNPPNLGPLDIVLKISDNQATALFTSPHSAVRDAVENALPRLREMLADNGIMLGNTTVSDQSPRDRSTDGSTNHDSGALARREASDDALEAAGLSLTTAQTVPVRRHNGMVDTFA